MKIISMFVTVCAVSGIFTSTVSAGPRDTIIAGFAAEAKAADPGFSGFSAKRGKGMFFKNYGTGKPDTPACTSCHGKAPQASGETRVGKPIDPIGVSKTPNRFTDPKKVAKWFRRNCKSVIGRVCTAAEKGDFITFMLSQ